MNGLVIRYGELALKKGNRRKFEDNLRRNVRQYLKRQGCVAPIVERLHGRFLVIAEGMHEGMFPGLSLIPGISSFSMAQVLRQPGKTELCQAAVEHFYRHVHPKGPTSFRVAVKRADKSFPVNSNDFERDIAEEIYLSGDMTDWSVNLTAAEQILEVDIRPEGTFILHDRVPGAGGLPVGVSGRVLCLLSGGIDSPVAAWRMMTRGCRVEFLSFYSPPYIGEESKQKLEELVDMLSAGQGSARLHVIPFTAIQEAVRDHVPDPWRTLCYRRFMFKVGNIIAGQRHCKAFVTGESLGQVASQTLENMTCIEHAAELPVLRPLVAMDKEEIVRIARTIGTFPVSIRPVPDTCTLFAPKSPKIKGNISDILHYESRFDAEGLVEAAAAAAEKYETGSR